MRKDVDHYIKLRRAELRLILTPYPPLIRKLGKTILNLILPTILKGNSVSENKIRSVFYFFNQKNITVEEFEQAITLINSLHSVDVIHYKLVEVNPNQYGLNTGELNFEKSYYSSADSETLFKIESILEA